MRYGSTAPNYPAQLQASMARWAATYSKFGGPDAFKHARRVVDAAIGHNMVELHKIGNPKKDPAELNLRLANVILAHVFKRGKDNRLDFPSEDFQRCALVVEGFNTFNELRENDLTYQRTDIYNRIRERNSLGTLARMVDVTQYGVDGPQSERELCALNPDKFYVFQMGRGKTEYEMIGYAAKHVYSYWADHDGYPELAGDLYKIYYQYVEPNMHESVLRTLEMLQARIDMTKLVAEAVISQLKLKLKRDGYRFTLKVRAAKHPGKVMEKTDRYMRDRGQGLEQVVSELNDLVAFTVILHSRKGVPVTQNDVEMFEEVAEAIVNIARGIQIMAPMPLDRMFTDYVTLPKENGYQSFHVDLPFIGQDVVNLEALIRNGRMERFAEKGGAAHAEYKKRVGGEAGPGYKNTCPEDSGILISTENTGIQKRIKVFVEGEKAPRTKIVDERACVGEALICAGIDLSNGLILTPNHSLLDPIRGIDALYLRQTDEKGQMLSRMLIDSLIKKAVYPHVLGTLREYRKNVTR